MFVKSPGLPKPKPTSVTSHHPDPYAFDVLTTQPSTEENEVQEAEGGGGWQNGQMD